MINRIFIERDKERFTQGVYYDAELKGEKIIISRNGESLLIVSASKDLKENFKYRKRLKAVLVDDKKGVLQIVRFADLHRHGGYSLLDGATKAKDMAQKTEYVGALTDHGNMFGVLEYYKEMKKLGKHPIIGCEVYMRGIDEEKGNYHAVLLVKNKIGYKNLCKIISKSQEDFYKKPLVSYELLEMHSEGLIFMTACLGGEIPRKIINKDLESVEKIINRLKSIFGTDDLYLEIQNHGISEEKIVRDSLVLLAKKHGLKIVATTDSHYLNKEDKFAHEVLLCLQTKKTINDPKRMIFSGEGYHIHSADEFEERFKDYPEAIDNTLEIAEKCSFDFEFGKIHLPQYTVPDGYTQDEYFEKLCRDGFKEKFKGTNQYDSKIYKERFEYEIDVIKKMGYSGYFIIVWDFINFAKTNGIMVGPGRGCFLPHTDILMANGTVKNIEDVKIGEKVITHKGNIKNVYATPRYEIEEKMYTVKAGGNEPITATNNHKFLVLKTDKCNHPSAKITYCKSNCKRYARCKYRKNQEIGWVEAQNLKVGDMLCIPKTKLENKKIAITDLSMFDNCLKMDSKFVWYKNKSETTKIKRFIVQDSEFARFAGYYIGNGYSTINEDSLHYTVGLSFNARRLDLVEDTEKLFKKIFGIKLNRYYNKNKTCIKLEAHSKLIAIFLKSIFGEKAIDKRIPDNLMTSNKKILKGLLYGLMNTDGNLIAKENRISYSSTSKSLIYQIQLLFIQLGFYGSIKMYRKKENNWANEFKLTLSGKQIISLKKSFPEINIKKQAYYRNDFMEDEKYFYVRIRKLSTMDYSGKVYDLSVEDDTSYMTNGFAVHNSAVGSLAAYCLKITDLDPILHGLLFERFLNPERISMPDIDTDFEDERRDEVIEYVANKYGRGNVSNIVTFGTLSAKMVVRDVTRVLEFPYSLGDKIAKAIPVKPKITIADAFKESPEFKMMYENEERVKEVVDIAMKLEGLPRHKSQHACFSEGTLINTEKGFKEIIDVKIGDKVLTHNKRYMEVVDTIKTKTNEVYTIKAASSFPIETTGNHPFLVRKMKYENYKLENGKWSKRKTFGKPTWENVSELIVGKDYVGIPINNNSIIPSKTRFKLPFEKKEFWWFIGRYIGNGWTEVKEHKYDNGNVSYENKIVICCSKKTILEKEGIEDCLSKLGLKYRVEIANTVYKINIIHQDLFDYLQEFGQYAHNKKLNADVLNLPKELAKAFLKGYFSADGHYLKERDRYFVKTVSKSLAIGTMQTIHKVYHRPVAVQILPSDKGTIEGRTVNRREKYEVFFIKDTRKKERSFYEGGYIWSRLSTLKKRTENKDMYNLTVLGDSSYTANNVAVHNCGILISEEEVSNFVPEVMTENKATKKKSLSAGFDMTELEEIGLLKMDFLGLRNLGVIKDSINFINKRRVKKGLSTISANSIPLTDVSVYKFIGTGKTNAIFQIEGQGMKNLMRDMFYDIEDRIKEVEEKYEGEDMGKELENLGWEFYERLTAAISLFRPGPMDEIPKYIKNMKNPENIVYDVPELEPILKNTYGVIVYQEQVMQIVQQLAGYSLGRADLVRRAMGKKKEEIMKQEKEYFINGKLNEDGTIDVPGCVRNGIPKEKAEIIWGKMADFAKYAFNKSHSAAYPVITVITAWLKYYYPLEFMTATLNSVILDNKKLPVYLEDAKSIGIELLPPDVNMSQEKFSIEGDSIRYGFMGIRNIGKVAGQIISERELNGQFCSYQNFAERMAVAHKIDKKMLEALVYSSALDSFEGTRRAKIEILGQILESAKIEKRNNETGQLDIFSLNKDFLVFKTIKTPEMKEFDKKYKLEKEKEFAGFYVTEHPLDEYDKLLKEKDIYEIAFLTMNENNSEEGEEDIAEYSYNGEKVKVAGIIKNIKIFYTKNNKILKTFTLEDKTGEIKGVIFERQLKYYEDLLQENAVVVVDGMIKEDDFGTQIIVNKIVGIEYLTRKTDPANLIVNVKDKSEISEIGNIADKSKEGDTTIYILFRDKRYKYKKKIALDYATFSNLVNNYNVEMEYVG